MLRVERINDYSCIFFPTSKPVQGVQLMTPKRVGKQCDSSGGAKKLRETWVESSRTYLVFAVPLPSCRFDISLRLFTERPNQATYSLEPTFVSPWSPIL